MSEPSSVGQLVPGMPIYGADGVLLGRIEALDAGWFNVRGRAVPPDAIARVGADGVHLVLTRVDFADAATAGGAPGEHLVVPVAEERLTVGTRQVQIGEVQVTKRVVEEQVLVPVTVRREEVEIIRRAPGESREEIDDPSIVEIIRIPLRGEEPVIATRAVVTSEVVINRTVQSEQRVVAGTVRATDVTVAEHPGEVRALPQERRGEGPPR